MSRIVAISSCIAGIAHTMMAKKALENAASALGVDIKVETQGMCGIENRITDEDIETADVAIFAVDASVDERERFDDIEVLEVGTSETIKDPESVIKNALELVHE
ncbi:EIIBCA-Man [Chlamydia trachomatis]|jgi:hypothetical protein|nr:EIIBCA-Man [Chlamydia trachomatis]